MCNRPTDSFRRILVAGCGTGVEALILTQTYPNAEIICVDFCARSIREASILKKKAGQRARPLTFLHADLTQRNLVDIVGDDFVFSCIPRATAVLKNFSRCLGPDGILYIGANGSAHYSERWRPALRDLGVNLRRYRPTGDLGCYLKIFDAVEGNSAQPISRMPAEYLSSDLITGYIRNKPLGWWIKSCRNAGLHFVAELNAFRNVRKPAAARLLDVLAPRTRAEVQQLTALIEPAGFNRMLFMKRPLPKPPLNVKEILQSNANRTGLYRMTTNSRRTRLVLTSQAVNTRVEINPARWITRFLRRADGKRSVRQLLQMIAARPSSEQLPSILYMLYQLGGLNFDD
jgi:SAM-dependent methyltransferase